MGTDFKTYRPKNSEGKGAPVRARKVEDSEQVLGVGNAVVTANAGDYIVERHESPRGVFDVIPGEAFDKSYASGPVPSGNNNPNK